MSEVVGYILTFGILSIVLVLAMTAFSVASGNAADDAARLQADSTAQQIATVALEAGLFAEARGESATYARLLELPDTFEGRQYTFTLEYADGTRPDRAMVAVPAIGYEASAALLSVGAAAGVDVCEHTLPGGSLSVRFGANPGYPTSGGSAATCIHLEASP